MRYLLKPQWAPTKAPIPTPAMNSRTKVLKLTVNSMLSSVTTNKHAKREYHPYDKRQRAGVQGYLHSSAEHTVVFEYVRKSELAPPKLVADVLRR